MSNFFALATGIIGLVVGLNIRKEKKNSEKDYPPSKSRNHYNHITLPSDLGIKKGTSYTDALNKLKKELDESLDNSYMGNVKNRVLKHTNWDTHEYDIYLYGMKQFLLMNAVLKSVSMFSEEVDEIWHEMLMFTREYQDFSNRFMGSTLHHTPNVNTDSGDANSRAEFDWIYSQLFDVNEAALYIYKGFFEFPLGKNRKEELSSMTEDAFKNHYFRENSRVSLISDSISKTLKKQLRDAEKSKWTTNSSSVSRVKKKEATNYTNDDIGTALLFDYDNSHSSKSSDYHSCGSSSTSSKHSCKSCSSCSSSSSHHSCSSCSSCGGGGD